MEKVLIDLATNLPVAVAMLIIVWFFLSHLRDERVARSKDMDRRHETYFNEMRQWRDADHTVMEKLDETIKENSVQLGKCSSALDRVAQHFDMGDSQV